MRVEYNTVDEFLQDLRDEKDSVWEKTVRLRIDKGPIDDNEVKHQVGLWLTAIVKKDSGEYVMELGAVCGIDMEDSAPERPGSELANRWKAIVKDTCKELGLKAKPGKYEIL